MNVLCFCSLDLNVKNSVMPFFCLSIQISESIIPTRPDNRGSTVLVKLKSRDVLTQKVS